MKVLQIYIRLHLLQIYIHHYVNVAAIATFVLLFSLSIKNFLNFKVNKSKLKKKKSFARNRILRLHQLFRLKILSVPTEPTLRETLMKLDFICSLYFRPQTDDMNHCTR